MPAPPHSRVRASGRAVQAAGGSAPRAIRGPPAPPPAPGKPRGRRPPHRTQTVPHLSSPPACGRSRVAQPRGPEASRPRAGGPRWRGSTRQSRPLGARQRRLWRSLLPGTRAPSPFEHRASPGLGRGLLSKTKAFAAGSTLPDRKKTSTQCSAWSPKHRGCLAASGRWAGGRAHWPQFFIGAPAGGATSSSSGSASLSHSKRSCSVSR
ncbi:uncharacterized protein [Chlorocebus sabaeus]|uniref:uncharacterized protein isoform X2 n=1 Tax=Chlorocebus sabaeus TaxID=60711 RepID=UPI003BF94A71